MKTVTEPAITAKRVAKTVAVGRGAEGVLVGGGNRISVQSMTSCDTLNRVAVLKQIEDLTSEGCDIIRIAVENAAAAEACKEYLNCSKVPLAADIHFDYRLAVLCSDIGFAKIRVNPGNIGGEDTLREVIAACKANKTVVRIGVNGGSLERGLKEKYGVCAQSLAESALLSVQAIEKYNFSDIIVSVKSSSVKTTVETNRILSRLCPYPLHIGVTESGFGQQGLIKSAIGIGALLLDSIGDTIRVSLTADPVEEVRAGKAILKSLGLLPHIEIVSCPTCSRCKYNLSFVAGEISEFATDLEKRVNLKESVKVAVMGCAVNGPGEASEADVGVAGGGAGKAVIFKKGRIVKTIDAVCASAELKAAIEEIIKAV